MVFMVQISQIFYKICFIPYSTTISIKKQPPGKELKAVKDKGGGVGVGLTAVKDSMGFFLTFPYLDVDNLFIYIYIYIYQLHKAIFRGLSR